MGTDSGVGVFIAPGNGFPTVQVAAEGDRLGAATLEAISTDFVGIDDSRRVVFVEALPDGRLQLVVADGSWRRSATRLIQGRRSSRRG